MDASQYLQAYENYFWQWEENAEIAAIPDAYTIAYRSYITETLEMLAPLGLPPFGAVLLALIATNANGKQAVDVVYSLVSRAQTPDEYQELADAIVFLTMLSDTPDEYKQGHKRFLLLQTIFQFAHNKISPKESQIIVQACLQQDAAKSALSAAAPLNPTIVHREFRIFSLLKSRFPDVASIIKAITALPAIPDTFPPIEKDTEKEEAPQDFVQQLIDNRNTFYVGALIQRIWGSFNIPFQNNLPSRQPFGGVSDITNKGDYDKLLHFEFANDDIVFLSRLANNEALFFNREIPPSDNNRRRIILIDVSLKNWGAIKTIAFASMLAIAKHPKTDIACTAYAVGEGYYPVSFENTDTLIDALQILDGSLHAGAGLAQYFKDHEVGDKEIILISSAESLAHAGVQKALSDSGSPIRYWIHPSQNGEVSVYQQRRTGKQRIQTIRLPLKELWKRDYRDPELRDGGDDVSFPILFPNPMTKLIFATEDGTLFKLNKDKYLLRQRTPYTDSSRNGWEIVYGGLPFAHGEYAMGHNAQGEYILLMYNPQLKEISLLNIDRDEIKSSAFRHWSPRKGPDFFFHEQKFYHLGYLDSWAIDLDGEIRVAEKSAENLADIYKSKNAEQSTIHRKAGYPTQVFKNVDKAYINQNANLVFNIHELSVNNSGAIKLDRTDHRAEKYAAKRVADGLFEFADGSTIRINRCGLFILQSSDDHIPTIYVPSALGRALGVATDRVFAGNEFYLKSPIYTVTLLDAVGDLIKTIKCIRSILGLGLYDVRTRIDAAPSVIGKALSKDKALELQSGLENLGAKVELSKVGVQPEIMKSNDFFDEFIKPFIERITRHATEH